MTRVFVLLNSSQEMRYPVGTRQEAVEHTVTPEEQTETAILESGRGTCEDAVLLRRILPAHFERCVQDFCEAQVTYRSRGCAYRHPH